MLSVTRRLRYLYLAYLSTPSQYRRLYRDIHRRRVLKILELGFESGQRAVRMIEAATLHAPAGQIRYTGVDPFEARSAADGPGVTLKLAHRLLKATGARTRLLPGDPFSALSRAANDLSGTDLVVVSSRVDAPSLARAWFYVPRMLHDGSRVFVERNVGGGSTVLERLGRDEIERLAAEAAVRRAA